MYVVVIFCSKPGLIQTLLSVDLQETNETEATKCEVCQLQLTSLKQLKEHISGE